MIKAGSPRFRGIRTLRGRLLPWVKRSVRRSHISLCQCSAFGDNAEKNGWLGALSLVHMITRQCCSFLGSLLLRPRRSCRSHVRGSLPLYASPVLFFACSYLMRLSRRAPLTPTSIGETPHTHRLTCSSHRCLPINLSDLVDHVTFL